MAKSIPPYGPEVRARGVRMVMDHQDEHGSQWAAIHSIAWKIGCSGETPRDWVRRTERDDGARPGPTSAEQEELARLRRENREPRQGEEDQENVRWMFSPTNEILRKASAYFAMAELVLSTRRLPRQKGAAARHREPRGSGGGGVARSLVSQDRGRV